MTVSRTRLPDRRPSVTMPVTYRGMGGNEIKVLVTFSFNESGVVREVFCADFKAGTDNHALVVDASILLSRLLQMGLEARHLVASLCEPPSLIGTVARAAAKLDEERES